MGKSSSKGFNPPPKSFLKEVRKQRKGELRNSPLDKKPSIFTSSPDDEDLSSENIKEYLITNPTFLDEFVRRQISQDRVKTWIKVAKETKPEVADSEEQPIDSETGVDKTEKPKPESKFKKNEERSQSRQQLKLLNITRSFLKYPRHCKQDELYELLDRPLPDKDPPDMESHLFPHTDISPNDISKAFVYMCHKLFGRRGFPMPQLAYFLSTLESNYFGVEYHNYRHALSHAQSMYWIFRMNPGLFTELEMKAMMIACISHDAGHPGFNETFLKAVGHGLAAVYQSPVLELHHTQTCLLILSDLSCNIFCNLPLSDYNKVLRDIQHCILSTCFERYKAQTEQLEHLAEINFNITDDAEKDALKSVLMMVCDLASSWKTWQVHKLTVWSLYREFFKQGDKEVKYGLDTGPQMMRLNLEEIPNYQVSFLEKLALPIFNLVARVLPNIRVIVDATLQNLDLWKTYTRDGT